MTIAFTKTHGLGNDFVIIDNRQQKAQLTEQAIRKISDRHYGVGCDQLLLITHSKSADCFVRIYNADGSEAEACGNGMRAVAKYLLELHKKDTMVVETCNRHVATKLMAGGSIQVHMGQPRFGWQEIPLSQEVDTMNVPVSAFGIDQIACVNVGNPHAIIFVEDLDSIDVGVIGKTLENHAIFPEKANINFAQIMDKNNIRLKVWERGTGITLACGSGACATQAIAYKKGLTDDTVRIHLPGGSLEVKIDGNGEIIMIGEAETVFAGVLYIV